MKKILNTGNHFNGMSHHGDYLYLFDWILISWQVTADFVRLLLKKTA